MNNPNQLPPETVIDTWAMLCIFLGGSTDSFTGMLLHLIAKADPFNLNRLRRAFPEEVRAWQIWMEAPKSLAAAEFDEWEKAINEGRVTV